MDISHKCRLGHKIKIKLNVTLNWYMTQVKIWALNENDIERINHTSEDYELKLKLKQY